MNPNLNVTSFNTTLATVSSWFAVYAFLYVIVIVYALLNYTIVSYTLQKIGEYLDHPYPWTGWFPAYKILMLVQMSEKPWWWLFVFYLAPVMVFIPIVGWIIIPMLVLVLLCIILADILDKIDSPQWWCILLVLPIVNLVLSLVICNDLSTKDKISCIDFSPSENDSEEISEKNFSNQYNQQRNTKGTLVIIEGESTGKGYRLDSNTIYIIGRAGNISLPMDDKTASREHARIRFENDKFVIYDLGSTNKTRVNNQVITRKVMMNGDEVKTGKTIFKFQWNRS